MEALSIQKKIHDYIVGLPDYAARPYELRMSGAGDCPRMADYLMRDGVGGADYSHAMRMHTGTWLHKMWREIKVGAFGDDYVGSEEEISIEVEGRKIYGHPDGIFKSVRAVDEFKSCSDSTFHMVRTNGAPIPAHYEQGNTYCGALELDQVVFHYFNKDSGESLFLIAPFNRAVFDMTIEKFRQRIINNIRGTIAGRPYADPTATPCWFCRKKDECYEGFTSEVKAMARVAFSPDTETELYSLVSLVDEHRQKRLDSEKIETENKSNVAKLLLSRGINACDIGEFDVQIKLGKNGNSLVNVKKVGGQ